MYNGSSMAVGGGKGGKCYHFGMGLMVFWTLMWITGIVLLTIGLNNRAEVDSFNPSTDFSPITGGCTVITVKHSEDQRQDRNPYCVDVYLYTFNSSLGVFLSAPEEISRGSGTWCDDSNQVEAQLSEGEEVDCWQPANGKAKSNLETFYSCGNDPCIKVLDPQDEWNIANAFAIVFISLGSAFLGVGLPACGVAGWLSRKNYKQETSAYASG